MPLIHKRNRKGWWFVLVGGSSREVFVYGPYDSEAQANEIGIQECEVTNFNHPGYYVTNAVPTRIEAEGRATKARRELREAGYR